MRNGKIFIIDTSFWNDDKKILTLPDFHKAKNEMGVDAVINRIGQGLKADGSLYVDIDYVQNMILEEEAKLVRGSYYFLEHDQNKYPIGQAAAYGAKQARAVHKFMTTSGLIGEMPPACDSEENVRWGRLTRERIESDVIPMTSAYLETLSALFNNTELFYYCNRYFESLSKGLTKWQLWLAVLSGEAYDGNKDLDHFTIATIEQWGSFMDGRLFGFDNGAVDTNRWNKSPEYFNDMIRRWNPRSPLFVTPTPEDETPTDPYIPPPAEEPVAGRSKWVTMGKNLVANLRIRTTPAVNLWNMTGKSLPYGTEVAILEEYNDTKGNKWVRIGHEQWAAEIFNGTTLITRKW